MLQKLLSVVGLRISLIFWLHKGVSSDFNFSVSKMNTYCYIHVTNSVQIIFSPLKITMSCDCGFINYWFLDCCRFSKNIVLHSILRFLGLVRVNLRSVYLFFLFFCLRFLVYRVSARSIMFVSRKIRWAKPDQ